MSKLTADDAAPDFKLADQHGKTVKLTDFRGRKLLLYFYPKADTQGCSIRDARQELAALGLAVVGLSPDLPARQKKFDDKYNLSFPLLTDPDHAVAKPVALFRLIGYSYGHDRIPHLGASVSPPVQKTL